MKSLTKFLFAAALSAVMCSTINNVSAQQTIATWFCGPLVNGGGGTPAPFTNNTAAPNVIIYPITKGSGVGAVTTGDAYGGNTWTNAGIVDSESSSITNGLYVTYAVQAASGYTISFSTNFIFVHASSTGPHNAAIQYSTDGSNYSDIAQLIIASGTTSTVWTNDLATNSFLQNIAATTTNFFRIVNWGATGTAGTWYIYDPLPAALVSATNVLGTNDFLIAGSVTPVPPAQNLATWYCGPLLNGGGATPAPFTNNTAAANVIVYPITKGSGVGAVTTGGAYGGNTWTNAGIVDSESSSISNGLYVTYAVQAATNYTLSFFTNYIFAHASSTGPHNGVLEYSTNGLNYTDIGSITIASGTTSTVWTNNLSAYNFLQNVPSTTTNFFRIVNWGANGTAGTWYIYDPLPAALASATNVLGTNDFVISGGVASPLGVIAPTNLVVSPASITANAGTTASFGVSASGSPASALWYQIVGTTTNLIANATNDTLTLVNVLGVNTGSYFVILNNAAGSATSSVVSLTVIDPSIQVEPSSAQGVVDGTVQFVVTAAGIAPNYQWYFSDTNGNIVPGALTLGDGSVISGANGSTLTVANLQPADLTNFVVVVTNIYGAVTSSVASLIAGPNTPGSLPYTQGMLAFWDFDGPQFTNTAVNPNCLNNPAPFIGVGTASAVGTCYDPGTSPFSGSVDANDVGYDPSEGAYVFTPYGFEQPSPNFSWGTDNYPLTGTNKQDGVQFNVSTVGAKNITVSYDSRVSATASDYERLQYTTNGATWIDYPASSTFNGVGTTYFTYNYSLVGFPGVDNNPNFGFRVVTEWQSTATYGIGTTNTWVGTANSYGSGGTVTYDLVAVLGDAITNNNTPPFLSSFVNTNMVDTNILTLNFTANSAQMAASKLTFSVQTVDTVSATPFSQPLSPTFTVTNTGSTNFLLSISFAGSYIPDPVDAAPILVTATDTNGESTALSFLLTVSSINVPPTNTLTALPVTNTLANTSLTIPFVVGSARNAYTNLTYIVTSDNNTVVPVGNIVIGGGTNTGNPTVTIMPATNEVGNALISVTVFDNDPVEPRSTTANIAFVVRPNANTVAVDYFNYDSSGSLDTVAAGYWRHLSGVFGQLKVQAAPVGGVAVVDSADNTENLQAALLGSPYATNSGDVLYASMTVNMDPTKMPSVNGSYFTAFNDGSGTTANVEGLLVAATNGAAPGNYRLGIANVVGADSTSAQMFPQDLSPGVNYFVVVSLVLSNGYSTLWISPTNQSSSSVTDHTPPATATNLYSMADFELRESGTTAGSVSVGSLNAGLSFNSVFYPAQANPDSFGVTENTTNHLSPLPVDAGWDLSVVSVMPDTNGTATVSSGEITYIPTNNFTGTDTVGYTIMDNLGNLSSSTFTVLVTNQPPQIKPVSYSVAENSVNNVLNPLTNDVVETPGGSLSLVSVTPDNNGTATISGTNVVFTPTTGFTGISTIGYTVTDNLGGTNSSLITVTVGSLTPVPVSAQLFNGHLVLSWAGTAFNLQYATNVAGPYITVPSATSPYTNSTLTNAAGFYRLVH